MKSGTSPFEFIHRDDLHVLPEQAIEHEANLHTMFAIDKREGFGHIYYGLPDVGIIRIDADLQRQEIIPVPQQFKSMNFHSCKLAEIEGEWRLILTANEHELIAVFGLDGNLDLTIHRPEFAPYRANDAAYKPTDSVLVNNKLYIADGYAQNVISVYDLASHSWDFSFGGSTEDRHEDGKFRTAHSITLTPDKQHLIIADRWNSRLQIHNFDGSFVASHHLPYNAWLCGIDFIEWNGRWLGVIACLYDTDDEKQRPAPIYIVDGDSFEIVSTIRPKEELGIELAQRMHNVVWHSHDGKLYLICHSWNPGGFFILECVETEEIF